MARDLTHLTDEELAAVRRAVERIEAEEKLSPEQAAKLRDEAAELELNAIQRRIRKYFDVDAEGNKRYDLPDCDEGHPDYVLHERRGSCGRCARLLDPESVLTVPTVRIYSNNKGDIRKDGLSFNGQVYRPYRGKAYIEVVIVQRIEPPVPYGTQDNYVELERFRVYFEEP